MIDNRQLAERLIEGGKIEVEGSALLSLLTDEPAPLPPGFDFDRVEGMLLGLAIGDALGNTSEGLVPADRQARGEVRDYLPNRRAGNRRVGLPSDDTQLAFWMLEQLVADGGLIPDRVAGRFCSGEIFGIGQAVRAFVAAYSEPDVKWFEAGDRSAGNGALMRIAPVLVPHLREPSSALYADALLGATITHNDRASNACSVGFVHLLWEALRLEKPPAPRWWLETFCEVAAPLEGQTLYRPRNPNRSEEGPLVEFTRRVVEKAWEEGEATVDACNSWFSGAYLLETVPSVLYILMRHGHDPEEAIVRAVNDTVDNDTTAAIVGAAVGALHGRRALPPRWLDSLLGRTRSTDDGRVQQLVRQARERFWEGAGE